MLGNSSPAEAWYLWTAILAAMLIIIPGVAKGLREVWRGLRSIIRFAEAVPKLLTMVTAFGQLSEDFRKHAADDADFQNFIIRKLEHDTKEAQP